MDILYMAARSTPFHGPAILSERFGDFFESERRMLGQGGLI